MAILGGSGSRKVRIRVLRRLPTAKGRGLGRPRNDLEMENAVRQTEVTGTVVKIRTVAPAQAHLTTSTARSSRMICREGL